MIIGGTDIETSGLLDPDHRIVEVCVQRYEWDGSKPVLLDNLVQRIDPQRNIDAKAQAVHGISPDMLVGKPKWSQVAQTIRDRLDSCDVVVAHNGLEFDYRFYLQEFARVGVADPDFYPFDTMQSGRWACPDGKVPLLRELCFSSGVTYDPSKSHAADYDVEVMMQSFFYGLRRGVFVLPEIKSS